jgi:hypothetical protein
VAAPKTITVRNARQAIDSLIFLRQALRTADELSIALEALLHVDPHQRPGTAQHPRPDAEAEAEAGGGRGAVRQLMQALIRNLRCTPGAGQPLDLLRQSVDDAFTEGTAFSKSSAAMKNEECFAIRAGRHGLLDVSRKTFLQSVEDIHATADAYGRELGVPVRVMNSASRGYYLSVPSTLNPLPAGFTQAVLNARTISCSTEEISSLSDRAGEALASALRITSELLQELTSEARTHMDALFALTDSVALLDMLAGFADLVALSPHVYSRPHLHAVSPPPAQMQTQTQAGAGVVSARQPPHPLVIKTGRHAIISTFKQEGANSSFVPNDCFLGPGANVQVWR